MPEHPTIPPIDQALIDEVNAVTIKAQYLVMNKIAPLCERVGAIMTQMDHLKDAVDHDDDAIDEIRARLGYGVLLDTMGIMASHVGAAADAPTCSFDDPDWYNQLREQRHERWSKEVV